MRNDVSDDDDEDWYDEEESYNDEPDGSCPECGGTVYSFSDKCPHCGYWLSADDRREMYPVELMPFWMRATAVFIILAFLVCLLAFGWTLF